MSDGPATPSREEEMLGELAELDLALARHVQGKALASDDSDEINGLGRTYQRVARSLRQTLALKAKLAREREAAEASRPPRPQPVEPHADLQLVTPRQRAHIERARVAVTRWAEHERPDWDELDDIEVYEVLLELARDPEFLDTSVEALVSKVREIMGLTGSDDDPPQPDPAEPAVQDSA